MLLTILDIAEVFRKLSTTIHHHILHLPRLASKVQVYRDLRTSLKLNIYQLVCFVKDVGDSKRSAYSIWKGNQSLDVCHRCLP